MDLITIKEMYKCFLINNVSYMYWSGKTWFIEKDKSGRVCYISTDETITKYLIGDTYESKNC